MRGNHLGFLSYLRTMSLLEHERRVVYSPHVAPARSGSCSGRPTARTCPSMRSPAEIRWAGRSAAPGFRCLDWMRTTAPPATLKTRPARSSTASPSAYLLTLLQVPFGDQSL